MLKKNQNIYLYMSSEKKIKSNFNVLDTCSTFLTTYYVGFLFYYKVKVTWTDLILMGILVYNVLGHML